MRPLRALVVDDDPLTLEAVRRVLALAGHQVRVLSGGFGFACALRDFEPDVVLLDIHMPGLDGRGALRAARELQQIRPGRPLVYLHSGLSAEHLDELCREIGADGFICKPARRDDLLRTMITAAEPAQ